MLQQMICLPILLYLFIFLMNLIDCNDYSITHFNDKFCNTTDFSTIHFNIRSISNHFDDLSIFLESIKSTFSLIALSEIWLPSKENVQFYNIPNYNFECSLRPNSNYGGVGLYIHNFILYKILNVNSITGSESLWLTINVNNLNIIIGLIYRKPNANLYDFLSCLDQTLNGLKLDKNKLILLGDFNIDLNCTNNNVINYLSLLNSFNLNQLIKIPTRFTKCSSTLIDHMFTNIDDFFINSGTITTSIADHLPIFLVCNNLKSHFTKSNISIKKILDHNLFIESINNTDWKEVYGFSDPNLAFNFFLSLYSKSYQESHISNTFKPDKYHI